MERSTNVGSVSSGSQSQRCGWTVWTRSRRERKRGMTSGGGKEQFEIDQWHGAIHDAAAFAVAALAVEVAGAGVRMVERIEDDRFGLGAARDRGGFRHAESPDAPTLAR